MADLKEYKCPCCGAAIFFDINSQKMKCPYCSTEYELETLKSYDEDLKSSGESNYDWGKLSGGQWQEGETSGLVTYICNSCAGEIVGDENRAATSCPFCGNAVVIKHQFSGMLKPDYVIPFKLDKEAAKAALRNHYNKKRLLPKLFKTENHLDEIQGVYVPFWLFDADVDATIRFRATRITAWTSGDYNYTKTSYYSVVRGGGLSFEHVPADGSEKIADDIMESIEPFDFSQAVDFQTAYLAGFLADKYDVNSDTCVKRANERIKKSTESAFASTVKGYASVFPENSAVNVNNGKAKYALYPVWFLNTSWQGKNYKFAMNGQTGKFVGDLPCDNKLKRLWTLGLTGIITPVVLLLLYLIWLL